MMKKLPMITLVIIIIELIIGVICRTTFTNYNDLKYYNVALIEEEFLQDIQENLDEQYEKSKYIVKVKCISDVTFSFLRTYQLVEIEKVFKGSELTKGEQINVSTYSSRIYFDDMSVNMGFVNAMNKGEEYLVFLSEVKKSEEYATQIYLTPETIVTPIFAYDNHQNAIVPAKYEDYLIVNYTDVENNEFFATSEEGVSILNDVKQRLIRKYN